jgi:hypothetical protein
MESNGEALLLTASAGRDTASTTGMTATTCSNLAMVRGQNAGSPTNSGSRSQKRSRAQILFIFVQLEACGSYLLKQQVIKPGRMFA